LVIHAAWPERRQRGGFRPGVAERTCCNRCYGRGQTQRVEAALATLDEHERGSPEIRTTLASLRLAQHDPQAATAALAPAIDGSVGSQPFSVVAALLLERRRATRSATRPPPGAPWSGRSISPGPVARAWSQDTEGNT